MAAESERARRTEPAAAGEAPGASAFRALPSVEEALRSAPLARLATRVPRPLVVALVQRVLDAWRDAIRAGALDADAVRARVADGVLAREVEALARADEEAGLGRAINATGVVLHTGLGRAPLHPEAARAMEAAARGYCVLEVDRATGARWRRDERVSELVARLTGAEAAIAVNNNAAAVLLVLATFARGRAVVVSRGELVEIGGSFRLPEVMECAGVRLVEVGTTNRTRLADFRTAARARGPDAALLLKVHSSNFRQVGFVEEVAARELAELGRELGLRTAYDLGSGLLEGEGMRPLAARLGGEPLVREAVASGVDVVTFSGDKLLGGPQAGVAAGRREAVEALRRNPLYRALRLDKTAIAGLERTLELLARGRGDELPARALLLADEEELRAAAERLARAAREAGLAADVARAGSQPGSGSAPGVELPTWVARVAAADAPAAELARRLRSARPPVFARVQEERVLLDPRTLLPGDEEELVRALRALVEPAG